LGGGGASFEEKFRIKAPSDMGISETAKNRQFSGKNQPGYADGFLKFTPDPGSFLFLPPPN
jgi:hypothetical protein